MPYGLEKMRLVILIKVFSLLRLTQRLFLPQYHDRNLTGKVQVGDEHLSVSPDMTDAVLPRVSQLFQMVRGEIRTLKRFTR
jgi:hypothetical protein